MKTLITAAALVVATSTAAFAGAPDCGEHQDLCDKAYALGDANGWHNGINHQIDEAGLFTQEEVTALVLEGQYEVIEGYRADIDKLSAHYEATITDLNAEYETLLQQHADRTEEFQIWHEVGTHYYNQHLDLVRIISDHKTQAGKNFEADPRGYITFVFSYIEDLQRQLGLR